MDYLYENLGDERFQEFCQSLLQNEFPNTQSFPVGQPDGGRDSVTYFMESTKKEFAVFQVKYVRNPYQIKDVHKWLTETIKGEVEKIEKLIPQGATSYYLMTNVKGTAHMGAGAIDLVNNLLEENIKVPSVCWWRDDISRKLEANPLLKWSFPEILNGQEILNSVLFSNLNENKERRENVIKAYLADQHEIDNEVKFRQIDLQSQLLDLFTDVPIRIKKVSEDNRKHKKGVKWTSITPDSEYGSEREKLGAAEFLLHPKFQNETARILLEGGPGQGKSTISQYICQVHRARLLEKRSDLEKLPESTKSTPIRLPFKIDLRDIAAWVEKKNPYQIVLSEAYFENIWTNSLEAFLVAHIFYHSQLDDFTTNDLIAICKVSSILFVFDGFDEIANPEVREHVIDFINRGINRIAENSKSLQILITSRPAAFSNSVGFSVELYPHYELTEITPDTIEIYVKNWIRANRLGLKEAAEISRLIKEKLEMPHLRDLAKSPMQLAILLSLLRTRGESLPNKRTALYDSYIELFFNRESEKSTVIRDNRDLIIDIHRYLAWVLHSEAELSNNIGSIRLEDLKERLKNYLVNQGHETDITDQLFDVVKERVCALVSRVQGTFEFEVQPLREYFCARYLYNTSPYSPAGREKTGTKPERFEAISRNFYWQNVVRFFAGCFDQGELPMLTKKLRELQDDQILKFTNYPRILTAQILSDYVFTQYPLELKEVVEIIIDGLRIGSPVNPDQYLRSNQDSILLPEGCGREMIVKECFKQLKEGLKSDYSRELIDIINKNSYQKYELWLDHLAEVEGPELTQWLEYGAMLDVLEEADQEVLLNTLKTNDTVEQEKRFNVLANANQIKVIDNDLDSGKYTWTLF